ncbi:hypothetical protein EOM09_06545, partial [bacterium]|nr:hypothetical protein [bacterium]
TERTKLSGIAEGAEVNVNPDWTSGKSAKYLMAGSQEEVREGVFAEIATKCRGARIGYRDKNYHKNKYLFFKSLGIEIIQIFENEWIENEEIVMSIIKTKLNLCKNKIYARKCIVKSINNQQYSDFCNQNHLQGYGIAKIRLGLFYNDELVKIMSFSKSRFNKNYDWENIRTCSKINTSIIGGFSKLLKYFTMSI